MNALVHLSPQVSLTSLLYKAFQGVREAQPLLGLKGWSQLLSCSEGELQAARLQQENVWPLVDIYSLLSSLPALQEVEITLFNELGSTRFSGCFSAPKLCLNCPGYLGLKLQLGRVSLQLNMDSWYWGCAVEDQSQGKELQKSLQFFNAQGERLLKIQASPETSESAWQELIRRFASSKNMTIPLFTTRPHPTEKQGPDDMAAFARDWRLMAHPDHLEFLLNRYQSGYLPALQKLDDKFAREVSLDALSVFLKKAMQLSKSSNKELLEMLFFAEGCLHRVSGTLQPPRLQHKTLCIAYAGGCLHLDPELLQEAWVVRKPLGEGWITSLEIFDNRGHQVLQLQENKSENQPENLALRQIFQTLF